jgi:hypothetical protein
MGMNCRQLGNGGHGNGGQLRNGRRLGSTIAATTLATLTLTAVCLAGARSVAVNDTGHLRLLKASGSILLEEGPAGGSLPGTTRATLDVGSSVHASFTIRASGGSIHGRGGATLHSSGRYASFGGWLSVTGGSGRYSHAHGSGKLYGVIDRRSDAVTVQTLGKLYY